MPTGSTDHLPQALAATSVDDDRALALRHDLSGGGLGHEIRNAIMPLVLHLDLLELRAADHGGARAFRRQESVDHLQRLANGLLMRATANAIAAAPVALSLREWWTAVGDLVRTPLGRNCTVDGDFPDTLPLVHAQPPVLAQVLLHLMVCTRLALPAGVWHSVTVTARRTVRGVSVTVRDGSEETGSSGSARGTAMASDWGVTLAQTLLQRSGGELSGYSTIDVGTHFTLQLPAAPPSSAAGSRPEHSQRTAARQAAHMSDRLAPVADSDGISTPGTTTSVLIVDDNTALTSALAMRLAIDGEFTCFSALQVLHDAVEHIAALHPSIVLLDLNLPGTERPLDVLRALRSRAPDIRVIVLTGRPSLEAIEGARDAGAAGFVAKGVHPDRLLTVMRRATTDGFMLELDG